MRYIFKNIRSFAKEYTRIWVLLIITIAASTLIIHLSYGMFQQYSDRKRISRNSTDQIQLRLDSSYTQKTVESSAGTMTQPTDLVYQTYERQDEVQDVTVGELKQFASELDAEIADNILDIYTGVLQGNYRFDTHFCISKGEIVNSGDYGADALYNYSDGNLKYNIFEYGRYFTDQEYARGDRVCIMQGWRNELRGTYLDENQVSEDEVLIGGEKYRIIGLQSGIGTGYIPVTSVKEDGLLLDELDLQFRDNISMREINMLHDTIKQCFGDRIHFNYSLEESDNNDAMYNTILLLVLLVSVVAALNFCALYHYVLTTRQRTLKIFRVCGLTHRKSIWLYLGECMVLSTGTYLVTLFLFQFLLMPILSGNISTFDYHYKPEVYLVLFLIYSVVSALIQFGMIVGTLKKKIVW